MHKATSGPRVFEQRTVVTTIILHDDPFTSVDVEAEQYREELSGTYSPLLLTQVMLDGRNVLHTLTQNELDSIFNALYVTFPFTKECKVEP